MNIPDTIVRNIIVRAPMERVYTAITDPDQIVKWFPDGIEGSPARGERPIMDFGDDGKFQIYVVDARPYTYFAFRWVSGSVLIPHGFRGDVLQNPNTLVEFMLAEVSDGTSVTLKESGFTSLPADQQEQAHKDNTGGWDYMMDRLEKLMNGD